MSIADPLLDKVVDQVHLPGKLKIRANFNDYIHLFHNQTAKRLFGNFYFIVTANLRLRHDDNAVEMAYLLDFDQQLRDLTKGRIGLDHAECKNLWRHLYVLAVTLILTVIADMSSSVVKQWYEADLLLLQTKYEKK